MPRNEELGKLTVDIDADSSGLKKGMTQAQSLLSKSLKGMSNLISKLKLPLLALGAVIAGTFAKLGYNFMQYQKSMSLTKVLMRSFSETTKRSLRDVQMGMLQLARTTGVSSKEQTDALNVLMQKLEGFASFDYMQDVLLPIVIDYAFANGKTPEEAAKDIAEAFLGEAPEELLMPVKIKYEEANPGKLFDDLTRAEKWQLILDYLKKFEGAAEEAGNTLWGAMKKMWTAIEELFNAIGDSADFKPVIDTINDLSDSIFDLAERIRNGDVPENLRGIMDGLNNLIPKVAEFLKNLTWEDIQKFMDKVKGLGELLLGLGAIGAAMSKFGETVSKAFGSILSVLGTIIASGIFIQLTKLLTNAWTPTSKLGKALFTLATGFTTTGSYIGVFLTNVGEAIKQHGLFKGALLAIYEAVMLVGRVFYEWVQRIFMFMGMVPQFRKAATLMYESFKSMGAGAALFMETMKGQGLVSALKGLPTILGMVAGDMSKFSTILGMASGTAAALFAVITAAVVAFIASWVNNWGDLRDRTKEAWSNIVETFRGIWENSLKPLFDSIGELFASLVNLIYEPIRLLLSKLGIDLPEITNLFTSLWDFLKIILKGIADSIGNGFALVIETIEFAVKTIGNAIGIIVEILEAVVKTIKAVLNTLVAIFTGNFDEIDDIWGQWGADMKSSGATILKYLGDFVADVIDWFGDLLSSFVRWIGNFVGKGKEWYDATIGLFSNITNGIRDWGNNIVGKFNDLKNGMGEKLDNAKESLSTFGSNVSTKTGEILSGAGTWVSNMGSKLLEFGGSVKDKLANALGIMTVYADDVEGEYAANEADTDSWSSKIGTKIDEFSTNIREKISGAVTTVQEKFADMKTAFSESVTNVGKSISEMVTKFATFKTDIESKISAVKTAVSEKMSGITTEVKNKITEIVNAVTNFGTQFYNAGAGLITKIVDGIKSKFYNISTAVGNLVDDAVDAITDWNYTFKSAGRGLIDAFWDGAVDKWDDFTDWIEDMLEDLRDWLPGSDAKTGPLSTLTKAGRGLFSAMQDGMEIQAPKFLDDVAKITESTRGLLPEGSMQGAVASSVAAAAPSVNLYISDSFFASERAKQELVDIVNEGLGRMRRK